MRICYEKGNCNKSRVHAVFFYAATVKLLQVKNREDA